MLENDDNFKSADIYISPPADSDSDEDSGPEDGGGIADNLPSNMLLAAAHMTIHRGDGSEEVGDEDDDAFSAEDGSTGDTVDVLDVDSGRPTDCVNSSKRKQSARAAVVDNVTGNQRRKRKFDNTAAANCATPAATATVTQSANMHTMMELNESVPVPTVTRKWEKKNISQSAPEWNGTKPEFLKNDMTPCFIFDSFWDTDVIEHTVKMSNLYAAQKGVANFEVTSDEVRGVLAILLISGYVSLHSRRMFWEQADDVANAAVSSIMSLNRFEEILRYLHFADNLNLAPGDKMAKVRPLFDLMNERYLKYWPVEQDVNVDESMIPYFGRHSSKQFIRGKPIRFGFKIWCLNTRLGYLVQCDPYQGKGSYVEPQFGLGGSVVRFLLRKLPQLNYCLYIDNYFTSLRLLDQLRNDHIAVVGTVRANRVEKCPLKDVSLMKKDERGTFDYRTDTTTGTVVVRWHDNSIVTIASNTFGTEPVARIRRWSAAKRAEVFI